VLAAILGHRHAAVVYRSPKGALRHCVWRVSLSGHVLNVDTYGCCSSRACAVHAPCVQTFWPDGPSLVVRCTRCGHDSRIGCDFAAVHLAHVLVLDGCVVWALRCCGAPAWLGVLTPNMRCSYTRPSMLLLAVGCQHGEHGRHLGVCVHMVAGQQLIVMVKCPKVEE
jgi:hypothetical protein